jgi:hypothetical protein
MELYKNDIERGKALIQNAMQRKKTRKKVKHELYSLTTRTSPKALCSDCIPNRRN